MAVQTRINTDDVAILLIDHQSGLFQTVKDIDVTALRNNVAALAQVAALENIPLFTTASEPNGPNGPLMPEIHALAPHAVYIPRNGEINAWDTPAFAEAVRKSGKKKLIIAGVLTSVCVAFPSLSAKSEGFEVFAVIDASGDMSTLSSQTTIARLTLAGVVPVSTVAVLGEIQKTWHREDALQYASAYTKVMPPYQSLIESYQKAISAGKEV
ncbi:nicotinamidase [Pedobacter lusitanus]|uniref:Contig59, whole genome shotgun sequence n=1 Tax=Pedobacter lusitanus TaxID=1503925 RepID=A0A0D0GPX8_9SPHI|nr:isochorismatase family protein [Pedobacter lusitanus]KIO76581.1 nicotinamidase [Pedobacter lusitanus]